MTDAPQARLYDAPQERWFDISSTPNVFPEYGDSERDYYTIRPFSAKQLLGRRHRTAEEDTVLVKEQNALRRARGFVPCESMSIMIRQMASDSIPLTPEEVIAMKLQPLTKYGMTILDPEFYVGTSDAEGENAIVPEDARNITDEIYRFYTEHNQPTWRDGRQIYLTPQEAWLLRHSSPDTYEGEAVKSLFMVSADNSIRSRDFLDEEQVVNISHQNSLREERGFAIFSTMHLSPDFSNELGIREDDGEVLAMKLGKIDEDGMTDDPEFAIGVWDEETKKFTPTEDPERNMNKTTEVFYAHHRDNDPPIPTYREERKRLNMQEGNPVVAEGQQSNIPDNPGGGSENKG